MRSRHANVWCLRDLVGGFLVVFGVLVPSSPTLVAVSAVFVRCWLALFFLPTVFFFVVVGVVPLALGPPCSRARSRKKHPCDVEPVAGSIPSFSVFTLYACW